MGASEKGLGRLKYHDESQRCEENWISVVEAKEGRRSRDPDFGISEAQRKVRASDRPHTRHSQEDDCDPSPEYGFDGKIGIWPFTVERVAKRSSRTGNVAGVTMILEDVKVDAVEYQKKITMNGGVFDCMRQKMPWFKAGSGKPEAGCVLYMQQDGARPHTTAANLQHFACEGAKYGFNIIVITQSAQSPDFNYNDLSFFNSLNSDVRIQSMSNRKDIIVAVKKCFAEYEADRMAGCIRSLTNSYRGCLETGGGNTYKTHRGVAKNARNGIEDFAVAKSVVDKARLTLAQLKAAGEDPDPTPGAPTPTLTDQELGLDFGRFSETSSSEEEEKESGSEGE